MTNETETLASTLLVETREELARADGKAAMLLAAFSLFVGVVLAGLIAGEFSPADLNCTGQKLWWVGCSAIGGSLVILAGAIYPRLKHGEAEGPISYFGHAAGKKVPVVEAALKRQVSNSRSRTIEQLVVVSDIVWQKYRAIQIALWVFGVGAILCFVGVLLD
jgi:hypothetical protein